MIFELGVIVGIILIIIDVAIIANNTADIKRLLERNLPK